MAIQDGRLLRGIILFMQVYIQYIKIDTSTVYLPNFSGHGQDGEVSHNSPVHPLIIGVMLFAQNVGKSPPKHIEPKNIIYTISVCLSTFVFLSYLGTMTYLK